MRISKDASPGLIMPVQRVCVKKLPPALARSNLTSPHHLVRRLLVQFGDGLIEGKRNYSGQCTRAERLAPALDLPLLRAWQRSSAIDSGVV